MRRALRRQALPRADAAPPRSARLIYHCAPHPFVLKLERMIKSCKCLTAYAAAFLLLLILAACSRDPKVQAQRYVDNANKFFAKGKFKEASILYRRALQKDLRFGEAYYRLGLTDLKLGAYGDAAHMLQRAVDLQPTNADAATKLADLYMLAAAQDAQHSADYQKEVNELAAHLIDKALTLTTGTGSTANWPW